MLFASPAISDPKYVACVVKGHHRKFSIHPKHTVRANAGYLDRQGYQKAGLDTKRTVTLKICFCRGLDRPLFQILTPQSCLLRYWQRRYHFSGICSCSRLRLKEKQQNHPSLIWNLSELLSTMLGMWQGGEVGWLTETVPLMCLLDTNTGVNSHIHFGRVDSQQFGKVSIPSPSSIYVWGNWGSAMFHRLVQHHSEACWPRPLTMLSTMLESLQVRSRFGGLIQKAPYSGWFSRGPSSVLGALH